MTSSIMEVKPSVILRQWYYKVPQLAYRGSDGEGIKQAVDLFFYGVVGELFKLIDPEPVHEIACGAEITVTRTKAQYNMASTTLELELRYSGEDIIPLLLRNPTIAAANSPYLSYHKSQRLIDDTDWFRVSFSTGPMPF